MKKLRLEFRMIASDVKGPRYLVQILLFRQLIFPTVKINSSMLNVTLNEWHRANKTTIEKRIKVFFTSAVELDVDWLLLRLAESLLLLVFPFLNAFLFSENFFNDVIIRQFKKVKVHNGKRVVRVKFETIKYQNTYSELRLKFVAPRI